jgi:hypothetical protein
MMSWRQGEIVLSCIKSLSVESTVYGLLHKQARVAALCWQWACRIRIVNSQESRVSLACPHWDSRVLGGRLFCVFKVVLYEFLRLRFGCHRLWNHGWSK